MTSLNIKKKAIDAMTVMNVAVSNIRLYPPISSIVRNTVDRVYQLLMDIIMQENSVIFAESEKNFIICGQFFSEEDQMQYPQAAAFLELLTEFGLKSISFEKKLTKPELKNFLEIISRRPEEIKEKGGLQTILRNENLPSIIMDHKVYVVLDKDKKVVTSFDIRDEDIIKYVTGEHFFSESELEKVKGVAKSPKWVNQVFQAGMIEVMDGKGLKSKEDIYEIISHMIDALDIIAAYADKDEIAAELAVSISDMEDEIIGVILSQNTETPFREKLFDYSIKQLNDIKFQRIASGLLKSVSDDKTENKSIKEKITLEKIRREKRLLQLKSGINGILRGDETPFLDEMLMNSLPDYIESLFSAGKEKTAEAVISKLSQGLSSRDSEIRDRISTILSNISNTLINEKRIESMVKTLEHILKWIRTETSVTPVYEQIFTNLQELAQNLLHDQRFVECMPILETFNHIVYGKLRKTPLIRSLAIKSLKKIAAEKTLADLLKEFKTNAASKRKDASAILVQLGEISINSFLNILQESRDMPERTRILQLISEIDEAPHIIIRKIREGGPWYYLRNLILMIGRAGNQKHLHALIPLLKHEDFRVQREALNSIYNIGGERRGEVLLSAFRSADERMKIHIVEMLGALQYKEAVPLLIESLESKKNFYNFQAGSKLKGKICSALGRIGDESAVPVLEAIAGQKSLLNEKDDSENLKEIAANALLKIRNLKNNKESGNSESKETNSDFEKNYGKVGRNDETIEESIIVMLFESIVRHAREKDFEKAEEMRRLLIELDAMAFNEIIRSGEIIEAEKNEAAAGVEKDHLGMWPDLYDLLTHEEANSLYYAMEESIYESDQTIFEQGEHNDKLYFIREGQLKLVFSRGKRESLLKIIGPGDIVGEDTFFSISVCTTSLITLSQVKLSYLNKKMLEIWGSEFPAFESKLHDYCLHLERVDDILKGKGMDRRSQKRVDIPGYVFIQLLNSSGTPAGKNFKGNLSDVSIGGISFYIKTGNRKSVSLLLGRRLSMEFYLPIVIWQRLDTNINDIPKDKAQLKINHVGTVISISHHMHNDYSIHIKFDKLLTDKIKEELVPSLSASSETSCVK